MINERTRAFVAEHGEWTAMAIRLPDGRYTREPAVDYSLPRLLQVAADKVRNPLDQCRVLDLACLEGHYAIEFALHGAEAVGSEGRAVSVAKCDYAKEALGLDRLSFRQDDVRNLSAAGYGRFDIVICSGLLYHLPAADVVALCRRMREVCDGILLLDTFVSLNGRVAIEVDGIAVRGHHYFEHEPDAGDKAAKLWASLDNESSFWLTQASLVNLLMAAGFATVSEVLAPTMPGNPDDRRTYLATCGRPVAIRSSEPTASAPMAPLPEGGSGTSDASQRERGPVFRMAKRLLPPVVKNLLKPPLRALGILPPDTTPGFQRKK